MSTQILVVDDEADSARFIAEALEGWGLEVVIASNGREGLYVLHTTPIDGVVLDLEMPVMNGWTMLDELRWQGSELPVIVMSKEAHCAKLQNLLKEGAQDYLVKPFSHLLLMQKTFRHFPWRTSVDKSPALLKSKAPEPNLPLALSWPQEVFGSVKENLTGK